MKQAWPAAAGVAVIVGLLSVRPGALTPVLWLAAIGLFFLAAAARRRLLVEARREGACEGARGGSPARPVVWLTVGGAAVAVGALLALLTAPGGH